jgi:integrase
VIHILDNVPKLQGNAFVFPGMKKGCPLSNMALLGVIGKMGFDKGGSREPFVPHGFRPSFRDWADETTNYPRDVAEMALAHAIPNKVEAAYRRGDLFEKRRLMIQDWSEFVCK